MNSYFLHRKGLVQLAEKLNNPEDRVRLFELIFELDKLFEEENPPPKKQRKIWTKVSDFVFSAVGRYAEHELLETVFHQFL